MKVYALYFKSEETGNDYRWRTLLKFGTSWNVIGSVVMKNPGSASPIRSIGDEETLYHLHSFCNKDEWFEFSVDNTMRNIEKLFISYYQEQINNPILDGVIQVFNLINVRDADLEIALAKNKKATLPFSKTIEQDISQLIPPVYLGWGALGFAPSFREDAERIFYFVYQKKEGLYLQREFENNLFYHPQYLIGRGKNRPKSQYLLNAFCQNTTSPTYKQIIIHKIRFSKEIVYNQVVEQLKKSFHPIEVKPGVCRFALNEELAISIAKTAEGYIGYRHINYKKNYTLDNYPHTHLYLSVLEKYGVNTSTKVWLGTKSFIDYGYNENEIIDEIINEIKSIKESIQL